MQGCSLFLSSSLNKIFLRKISFMYHDSSVLYSSWLSGDGAICLARKRCSTSALCFHVWILEMKSLSHDVFLPVNSRSPEMHDTIITNVQVKPVSLYELQICARVLNWFDIIFVAITSTSFHRND